MCDGPPFMNEPICRSAHITPVFRVGGGEPGFESRLDNTFESVEFIAGGSAVRRTLVHSQRIEDLAQTVLFLLDIFNEPEGGSLLTKQLGGRGLGVTKSADPKPGRKPEQNNEQSEARTQDELQADKS